MTNPWQQKDQLGFIPALFETIKAVLFHPREFFENLEIKGAHGVPLFFYCAVAIPASFIGSLWQVLFKPSLLGEVLISFFVSLILIPIFVFIVAGLMHLFLLLFGARGGFMATFNVVCYGGATMAFNVIPILGSLIASIWGIVVAVIGYKRVHKLSTAKAVCVVLIPTFVVIFALLAAIAVPNLLRARLSANEAMTKASVQILSSALEAYKAGHDRYPAKEDELRLSEPPYLDKAYDNQEIGGYRYTLSLKDDEYEIIAQPVACGTTGLRTFKQKSGEDMIEEQCK